MAAILFAIPAAKPLYLDNMDFPAVAKAAAETGLPIYYRGEENAHHSGLYHPPLYIYALAAWFRVWGFGEVQARLFGFACLFLHGWIVLYILRLLMGEEAQRRTVPWFWALFLLNPYTLQSAAVLDIDTTVYGPLLAGLLAAALRINWSDGQPRRDEVRMSEFGLIAALTALALWAKLTTVISVAPVLVLILVSRLGWRKAVLWGGGAIASGTALFLGSYALYGWATGQDILFTFRFTLMSFSQRAEGPEGWQWLAARWRLFQTMAVWQMLWSGMLPWAACAAVTAFLGWRGWVRGEDRSRDASLALLWALLVTGFYCGLIHTFGRSPFKYVFVGWGIVAGCTAFLASQAWERLSGLPPALHKRRYGAAAILFCACFAVSAGWLRDRSVLEGITRADKLALVLPAAVGLAALLFWRRKPAAAALSAAVVAYWGLMAGMALAMARAPYPTTYDYGMLGFDDTVCFIRAHTEPGDAILAMKDVGFRAGRRYFENYGYISGGPAAAEAARKLLAEGKARYAVFSEGIGPDYLGFNPALKEVVDSLCVLERSYGHHRIYDCARGAAPGGKP